MFATVPKFVDGKGGDSNMIILTEAAKMRFREIKPARGSNGEVLRLECVVDLTETPEGLGFAIGPPEAGREARS